MATPMTASQFIAALRAEGVTVVEVGNWPTHNRNSKGAWGPVNGVVIHHTVTSGTSNTVAYCRDGDSELPGPLCHGVIDKQGVVHLVGYGRANHAGGGDPKVLGAVSAESYGDRPPAPHEHQGSAGATDGNVHFYGFECINLGDGKDPWPAAQLEAIERVSAAICRHHGWSNKSIIGHLEWSDWKSDPRGFSMVDMRKRVATRLGQAATPTTPPKPSTPKYESFPGSSFFMTGTKPALGKSSPIFTAMGKQLVKKGFGRYYAVGPGPKLGQADVSAYEAFQRSLGYTGAAAEWPPGPKSWSQLQVPNV
ncbi:MULTISPECIES: peptidoglycan-binding protein [unclassified Streptomyces]|uniref:peptidoglycan-binding protein n=1 Tax=unclassified Streptomyces TaxID=2593676 RepID=UPI002E29F9EC|nr:peptidoglycan-binding protein [Streptomyces sp. NBC_00228]